MIDAATDLHCRKGKRQTGIGKYDAGGSTRHVGCVGDRDANIGLLERRSIINAVSGHADHVSRLLEETNKLDLALGEDARIHIVIERGAAIEMIQNVSRAAAVTNADLLRDGARSREVVAGDHYDAQAEFLETSEETLNQAAAGLPRRQAIQ